MQVALALWVCCLFAGCGLFGYELVPAATDEEHPEHWTDAQTTDTWDLDAGRIDARIPTPDVKRAMPPLFPDGGSSMDAASGGGRDADITDTATDGATDAVINVDAAIDGATDATIGTDAAIDEATDATVDTGQDAALPCGGTPVFGLCWYLGNLGQTCLQACAARGGFDTAATSHVGISSQGGSVTECGAVLSALGHTASPLASTRADNAGLGCHVWIDGTTWWIQTDALSPNASSPGASIACACNE